jgi:DNA-binding HxlR family transcriptional regulator
MSVWSVPLVRALADGPLAHDRLLGQVAGIDTRMLVLTLLSLENRGLVERRSERAYALTAVGRGVLRALP